MAETESPVAQSNADPVLIVGQGRSGTTLLVASLIRHPDLASAPETYFWRDLANWSGGWEAIAAHWPAAARQFLEHMDRWNELGLDAGQVIARVAPDDHTPAGLFRAMCDQIAANAGKTRTIEKTPSHIRYLDLIREHEPRVKVIHIIRDGRDVSISRRKFQWLSNSLTSLLYEWRRSVRLGETMLAGDSHAMAVQYEKLCTDPAGTLAAVCSFLGVAYRDQLLQPDGGEQQVIEHNARWKDGVSKPIYNARCEAWRRELSAPESIAAWAVAGDELARWGYAPPDDWPVKGAIRICLPQDIDRDAQGGVLDQLLHEAINRDACFTGWWNPLNEPPPRGADLAIIADTPQSSGWRSRGRIGLLRALWRFDRKLKRFLRRGGRIAWLHPGLDAPAGGWRANREYERIMAEAATVILLQQVVEPDEMPLPDKTIGIPNGQAGAKAIARAFARLNEPAGRRRSQ